MMVVSASAMVVVLLGPVIIGLVVKTQNLVVVIRDVGGGWCTGLQNKAKKGKHNQENPRSKISVYLLEREKRTPSIHSRVGIHVKKLSNEGHSIQRPILGQGDIGARGPSGGPTEIILF